MKSSYWFYVESCTTKTISWIKKKTSSAPPMSCECECMSATRNNTPFMTNKLKPTGILHTTARVWLKDYIQLNVQQVEHSLWICVQWRQLHKSIDPNENLFCTTPLRISLVYVHINRWMNECQSNFAVDVLSNVPVQAKTLIKHFQLLQIVIESIFIAGIILCGNQISLLW